MATDNCKVISALANVPFLFWLPLVVDDAKNEFGRFHANQGLLLLIIYAVLAVLNVIFSFAFLSIGFLWWIFNVIIYLAYLGALILMILGIYNAITNKTWEFPIIGKLKLIK